MPNAVHWLVHALVQELDKGVCDLDYPIWSLILGEDEDAKARGAFARACRECRIIVHHVRSGRNKNASLTLARRYGYPLNNRPWQQSLICVRDKEVKDIGTLATTLYTLNTMDRYASFVVLPRIGVMWVSKGQSTLVSTSMIRDAYLQIGDGWDNDGVMQRKKGLSEECVQMKLVCAAYGDGQLAVVACGGFNYHLRKSRHRVFVMHLGSHGQLSDWKAIKNWRAPPNPIACSNGPHVFFLGGGFDYFEEHDQLVWDDCTMYNVDTAERVTLPSLPECLGQFGAVFCGDTLYVAGGHGEDPDSEDPRLSRACFCLKFTVGDGNDPAFKPDADEWTTGPMLPDLTEATGRVSALEVYNGVLWARCYQTGGIFARLCTEQQCWIECNEHDKDAPSREITLGTLEDALYENPGKLQF